MRTKRNDGGRTGRWALGLAMLLWVGGCATAKEEESGLRDTGAATLHAIGGVRVACVPRYSDVPAGPVQRGAAWTERRECAGRVTADCYAELGAGATPTALTDCIAPRIERCEAAFHRSCGGEAAPWYGAN